MRTEDVEEFRAYTFENEIKSRIYQSETNHSTVFPHPRQKVRWPLQRNAFHSSIAARARPFSAYVQMHIDRQRREWNSQFFQESMSCFPGRERMIYREHGLMPVNANSQYISDEKSYYYAQDI